jgi:hypothetical protein
VSTICATGAFGQIVELELRLGDCELRTERLRFGDGGVEEAVQLVAAIVRRKKERDGACACAVAADGDMVGITAELHTSLAIFS